MIPVYIPLQYKSQFELLVNYEDYTHINKKIVNIFFSVYDVKFTLPELCKLNQDIKTCQIIFNTFISHPKLSTLDELLNYLFPETLDIGS